MWEVEYTDEFGVWWETLDAEEQVSVAASVELLRQLGPQLPRPHADVLKGSRHANMKEMRRFYHRMIPLADDLFDQHLATLEREGLI